MVVKVLPDAVDRVAVVFSAGPLAVFHAAAPVPAVGGAVLLAPAFRLAVAFAERRQNGVRSQVMPPGYDVHDHPAGVRSLEQPPANIPNQNTRTTAAATQRIS